MAAIAQPPETVSDLVGKIAKARPKKTRPPIEAASALLRLPGAGRQSVPAGSQQGILHEQGDVIGSRAHSIVIVVARDLVGRLLEGVQGIFQLVLRVL
jgi:hypothetical protein